jgi:hypothetical protein
LFFLGRMIVSSFCKPGDSITYRSWWSTQVQSYLPHFFDDVSIKKRRLHYARSCAETHLFVKVARGAQDDRTGLSDFRVDSNGSFEAGFADEAPSAHPQLAPCG